MTEKYEAAELPGRGAQILLDIAATIAAALVDEGLEAGRAQELGLLAADRVRDTYGGDQVYLPRGLSLMINRRDREIYEAFTGTNHFALAQQYNLTVRQIYTVVERVRRAEMVRRQMPLFAEHA